MDLVWFETAQQLHNYTNTEGKGQICKFYINTGACKFGTGCSRKHVTYKKSNVISIPNFFQFPRLTEHAFYLSELLQGYDKFYKDVIEGFRAIGKVKCFKCCINHVPHLRGNVYVQFTKHEYAAMAVQAFNGRNVDERTLEVTLSPVNNWKKSICGMFGKGICPRGKACNFLHTIRNPDNDYAVPNRVGFHPLNFTIQKSGAPLLPSEPLVEEAPAGSSDKKKPISAEIRSLLSAGPDDIIIFSSKECLEKIPLSGANLVEPTTLVVEREKSPPKSSATERHSPLKNSRSRSPHRSYSQSSSSKSPVRYIILDEC